MIKLIVNEPKIRIENEFESTTVHFEAVRVLNVYNETTLCEVEFKNYEIAWVEPYFYQLNLLNCIASHFVVHLTEIETALIKVQAVTCNHTFTFEHNEYRYLLLHDDLKVNVFVNDVIVSDDHVIELRIQFHHEGNSTFDGDRIETSLLKIKDYLKDTQQYITFVENTDILIDQSQFYIHLPVVDPNSNKAVQIGVNVNLGYAVFRFRPSNTVFYNFIVGTVPKLFDYEAYLTPKPFPESSSGRGDSSTGGGDNVSLGFKPQIPTTLLAYVVSACFASYTYLM